MSDTTEAPAPVSDATEAPIEAPEEADAGPEEGKKPDDRETRSHRSLNRKHEKLTRDLTKLRQEREAFEKERGSHAEQLQHAAQWRELSELSQKDRLAAARKLGLDYDAMTKEMLEEAQLSDAERATRREIAELKRERDEAKREAEQTARREEAKKARADLTNFFASAAKADPGTFKFTSQMDPQGLLRKVDAVVDELREKGGDVRSEEDLLEVLAFVEKRQARKAEKWRKLLGLTATQAAAKVVAEDAAPAKGARKTLSSRDAGDAGKSPPKTMTKEERKLASIAALKTITGET